MHSEQVHGGRLVILICANRSGYQGVWYLVGPTSLYPDATAESPVCKHFRQAVDVPVLSDGVRAIPLTRGKYALVDAADYPALIRHSWYAQCNDNGVQKSYYAVGKIKGRTVQMHRKILSARPGLVVDHINRNGLDNRRSNLRLCSPAENVRNTRSHRGSSSRYKGVSLDRKSGKWRVNISSNGKNTYLGLFDSEIAAAIAYNKIARKLFGKFAYLNKVDEASCFVGDPSENQ